MDLVQVLGIVREDSEVSKDTSGFRGVLSPSSRGVGTKLVNKSSPINAVQYSPFVVIPRTHRKGLTLLQRYGTLLFSNNILFLNGYKSTITRKSMQPIVSLYIFYTYHAAFSNLIQILFYKNLNFCFNLNKNNIQSLQFKL